jgi:hypothetical protein
MQMKKQTAPLKPRGLYGLFYERLLEANSSIKNYSKKDYIPFPVVFEKVCRGFSIKKFAAWEILFILRDVGLLEIVKSKGVKVYV